MDKEQYIKGMLDPKSRNYDRNKGLNADSLEQALNKATAYTRTLPDKDNNIWERMPGSSDDADQYGNILKPKNSNIWQEPVLTEEDCAIYEGIHIHSSTNPMGLHSHLKGGKLGGAHGHGPSNRMGQHTHKDIPTDAANYNRGYTIDGDHIHPMNSNKPCGPHNHSNETFG